MGVAMKRSAATVQRHPWEKWWKKRKFRLVRGRDYRNLTHAMAQQIRNRARKNGNGDRVHIEIAADGNSMRVEIK